MKNVLLKFAGLFVEKIPIDEHGRPVTDTPRPQGPPGQHSSAPSPAQLQQMQPMQPPPMPSQPQPTPSSPMPAAPGSPAQPASQAHQGEAVAIALRALVPEEYAGHLAPFGVQIMAAGGSITPEQARGWGAKVLIISADCLGQDIRLIQQPDMPTVFISPQPVMIPDMPGLVQVQEPLRASEVAEAARTALHAFRG